MKHILFILSMFALLWACNDETSFGVMMSQENLRFKAMPGGAMMYYSLPEEKNVYGLIVRYTNEAGKEIMKRASYVGDSLFLDGFNEEHKAVPAKVSLINNDNKESEIIDITFDTQESIPYAFFNDAVVIPSWEGFQLMYYTPDIVTGMAHVFYLGEDPRTGEPDTVLVKSFPIMAGGDTLIFPLKQVREKNTVIVRTENAKGYRVREKVWEDVEAYKTEKWTLTPENFNDGGLSVKNKDANTGVEYLFDGELKGIEKFRYGITAPETKTEKQFTYLAGSHAVGKPFVIDLGEKKIPASIRIYSIQAMMVYFPSTNSRKPLCTVWNWGYQDKLPCDITVYAGNDNNPDANTWVKVGSYLQAPSTPLEERWCFPVEEYSKRLNTEQEMEAAEPIYMEVSFLASQNEYRYLKFVVNDTFDNLRTGYEDQNWNLEEYVTMHELEVYVKKD